MQGRKVLEQKLFYSFSIEAAVPEDNFYRKLERAVDLSWVRQRVAECYSDIGRHSIDPEVIVKVELVGYLEGITSERQLMREIADRLSLRRYVGYDLDEEVPDHSTLSKARDLLGKDLFQAVFDRSVRLCQAAGMVGGVHSSVDRSVVQANASLDSLEPRVVEMSPEQFVERLFAENPAPAAEVAERREEMSPTDLCARPGYPRRLRAAVQSPVSEPSPSEAAASETPVGEAVSLPAVVQPSVSGRTLSEARASEPSASEVAVENGEDKKEKPTPSNYTHVSRTDPEAMIAKRRGKPAILGYSAEVWVDGRCGVITHADGFSANVPEQATVVQGLLRQRDEFGIAVSGLSGDKGYGQGRLYRQLNAHHVVGYIPHQEKVNSAGGPGLYREEDFTYDPSISGYKCKAGCVLKYKGVEVNWPSAGRVYQAAGRDCHRCDLRTKCTKAKGGRKLKVSIYQAEFHEMDKRLAGPGARLAAVARRVGPEPRFGQAKQWQGMDRAKYRGLQKFKGQVLMTAAAQNIKKYVNWVWRKGQGAGQKRMEDLGVARTFLLGLTLANQNALVPIN